MDLCRLALGRVAGGQLDVVSSTVWSGQLRYFRNATTTWAKTTLLDFGGSYSWAMVSLADFDKASGDVNVHGLRVFDSARSFALLLNRYKASLGNQPVIKDQVVVLVPRCEQGGIMMRCCAVCDFVCVCVCSGVSSGVNLKDGDLDIAASNIQKGSHYILANNGAGVFPGGAKFLGNCTGATAIVPADVDRHCAVLSSCCPLNDSFRLPH